jgi:excisionase family DNA binding protein
MQNVQESKRASGLLSADEVERMLGVDKSTVYRMAADGRLSAIKVGRQWRFPADPLRELFEAAGALPGPAAFLRPETVGGAEAVIIEPIVDLAAHLLGVMMVATDMGGVPLTGVANPCPWFTARQDDPEVLAQCIDDWRGLAQGVDFEPHLAIGSHGFECARVFIREGSHLVGMVLAGGILPVGSEIPGLYRLDGEARARLLAALPRIASTISRIIARTPSALRGTS